MEVAFAVGAEVEACANHRATLRAIVGQRLTHQQVNDEAEDQVAGHQHEHQEGP